MSGRREGRPDPASAKPGKADPSAEAREPATPDVLEGREARVRARAAGRETGPSGAVEPARLRPPVERPADDHRGQAIIIASWVGTGVFAAASIPSAVAPDAFAPLLIVVALGLFVVGMAIFALAYVTAIGRSREVLIGMGGLFFVAGGTAPQRVSRHLMGSFAAQCGLAVVTTIVGLFTVPADVTNPLAFGVLVPIYALALAGLWSARYGHFAPRPPEPTERRRRSTT